MNRRHSPLRRALSLLAAAAVAVPVSLLVAAPAQADERDYKLRWSPNAEGVNDAGQVETFAQVISDLKRDIGMVTMADVARTFQPETSCTDGIPAGTATLCFSSSDDYAEEWIPQGLTTYNDGHAGGVSPIFVSWYDGCSAGEQGSDWGRGHQGCQTDPAGTHRAKPKGVQVSIYVAGSGYRNVLLVEPFNNSADNASFHATHMHAGGMALFGRYLYVADTSHGFRVFDTQQILDMSKAGTSPQYPRNMNDYTQLGRHTNVYYSHGYRYLWPVVGEWKLEDGASPGGSGACQGNGTRLKFSYASIDRSTSPARLVAGEYCNNEPTEEDPDARGRVARWRLTNTTNPAAALTDGGWAEDAFHLPVTHVQGAVSRGNTFYFNTSAGQNPGTLHKYQLSGTTMTAAGTRTVAVGPEDLSYDTSLGAAGHRIFSLSEYYGKRAIYYVPAF